MINLEVTPHIQLYDVTVHTKFLFPPGHQLKCLQNSLKKYCVQDNLTLRGSEIFGTIKCLKNGKWPYVFGSQQEHSMIGYVSKQHDYIYGLHTSDDVLFKHRPDIYCQMLSECSQSPSSLSWSLYQSTGRRCIFALLLSHD